MSGTDRPGREIRPPVLAGLDYVSLLGSGGYSDVFLYEQQQPRMRVAVKVLAAHQLSPAALRQFGAEANAMAQLADHPFIVQVFRAGLADDGRPYIVMKHFPQPNLALRARSERFAVADVLRIGIQICSAVEAAHRVGILHRDIKPANVLTGQYGTLGLTDFGIAATKAEAAAGQTDGVSIPWAAPEVLHSADRADERSDVYSIAATVWHLLAGRSPFDQRGGDNSALALMHRITASPVPSTGRGDVPPSLERLLSTAMAKDPATRPRSALAFARALQAVEQEQRLALTPIVVDDDGAAAINARSAQPDEDGTRVRSAVVVEGADARPGDEDPTRRKQPTQLPAQPALPPWAPPGVGGPPPAASPPARPGRGLGRPVALGAAAAVAAGAVIALVVALGGHGDAKHVTTPTVSNPAQTQNAVPTSAPAPGVPTVTAHATGTTVRFSWTYQGAASDDSFQWREPSTTSAGIANRPEITVPAAGRSTCLQVRVLRFDGSAASDWSAPACG